MIDQFYEGSQQNNISQEVSVNTNINHHTSSASQVLHEAIIDLYL